LEHRELRNAKEDHWKVKEACKEREEERRTIEHLFVMQCKAKEAAHKEKKKSTRPTNTGSMTTE